MKKNILKIIIAGVFLLTMGLSFTMNSSSQITKVDINTLSVGQEAQAICREYYEDVFVCCDLGGGNCTNAVNEEYKGPWFIYPQ